MIVERLIEYYDRASKIDSKNVAPMGMYKRPVRFIIVIDKDGNFINLVDTKASNPDGGGKLYLVPIPQVRSGTAAWKYPTLLCDHYGYVLQQSPIKDKTKNDPRGLDEFIKKIESLPESLKNHEEILAVRRFYQNKDTNIKKVLEHENWNVCHKINNATMTFQLDSAIAPVTEIPELIDWISNEECNNDFEGEDSKEEGYRDWCLVTGEYTKIQRVHHKFSAFPGKRKPSLINFQMDSGYDSYGYKQGYNGGVSKEAEAKYRAAMQMLIESEQNHIWIGDTVFLFWHMPKDIYNKSLYGIENRIRMLFSGRVGDKDDPDNAVNQIRSMYNSINDGKIPTDTGDKFYVAGMKQNGPRIRVVLDSEGTIKDVAKRIINYLDDINIVRVKKDKAPTMWSILASSTLNKKVWKIKPDLVASFFRAVLYGTHYPPELAYNIMSRIYAQGYPTSTQIAYLKAYNNRNLKGDLITMALDKNNNNVGYRIGRLLALEEMVQSKSIRKDSVKDLYISMSNVPGEVIGRVLDLFSVHKAQLPANLQIYFTKEMEDIFSGIGSEIPFALDEKEKVQFHIGYYHEKSYLYTKKDTDSSEATDTNSENVEVVSENEEMAIGE